ncbi:hypothetical protein A1Q1_05994 [Trichosporon asahii var. asahii CBS 2479]|uniref:Uncharacterized protein n=1 Tax=Trichosporon asahii var. asahii (strain ATCC 90039 / CBS 2479 / JCM 2466 / KCTC 7840 / NBRC 103889/ NCYC 2677 / UAMH 7654) TaxID=1186058 RepID=J5Q5D6_TRIAS|nr:hypothetical protein A1Q1_05994 [Trichosporon asahii var. asahii CBS 2479]EJT45548.1 hypothetical protein A1Q1_05994 [Trichosporon asahii var. asahii CBS 2479]
MTRDTSPIRGCFALKSTVNPPRHLPSEHSASCPKCPGHPLLTPAEQESFAKKEQTALEKQKRQVEGYLKKIGKSSSTSPSPPPPLPPSHSVQWASYLSALQAAQESQRAAEWPRTEADWLVYAKLLAASKATTHPPPAPPQDGSMEAWQAYASVAAYQAQQAQKEWEKHLASQVAAAEAASAASGESERPRDTALDRTHDGEGGES